MNTGPVGDPNPGMVLADLVHPVDQSERSSILGRAHAVDNRPPVYKPIDVEPLQQTPPDFVVTFTEDQNGFYINGRKFAADAPPMTTALVGTYQHWRVSTKPPNSILSTFTRFTSWLMRKMARHFPILLGWIL